MTQSDLFLRLTTDLLSRGCRLRFRASGSSMLPTIREGEIITVQPVRPSEVHVGDIVLYRSRPGVIAHRVVRIEAGSFLVQGDACDRADQPVLGDQLLGRVVAVDRAGRLIRVVGRRARARRMLRAGGSRLVRGLRSRAFGRTKAALAAPVCKT